jgi:hypothetical protein
MGLPNGAPVGRVRGLDSRAQVEMMADESAELADGFDAKLADATVALRMQVGPSLAAIMA